MSMTEFKARRLSYPFLYTFSKDLRLHEKFKDGYRYTYWPEIYWKKKI